MSDEAWREYRRKQFHFQRVRNRRYAKEMIANAPCQLCEKLGRTNGEDERLQPG